MSLFKIILRFLLAITGLASYIQLPTRYSERHSIHRDPYARFNNTQNESWQSWPHTMSFIGKIRLKRVCFCLMSVIVFFCLPSFIYGYLQLYRTGVLGGPYRCPFSSTLTKDTVRFDSSHRIRHFPQFVCPQNFRNLADWVYDWPDQFLEHLDVTTSNGKTIAPYLPPGSIIYVRIWAIDQFFAQIYPNLINNFVLVTGEGDLSSPTHLDKLQASDSKIIHWFGQNGQYDVLKTDKFTHIPIGINCYEMADAIYGVHSQHSSDTLPSVFNHPDEPSVYIQPRDISRRALSTNISRDHLVLINFSPETDGTNLRARIVQEMCANNSKQKYPFVQCFTKQFGVQIKDLSKIYERNRQYPFWLSPRGNGLDCHRTWEALYLDIIPIVWNNSLTVLYENLPVVIINNTTELTEQFLYQKLEEISKKKISKNQLYQYEKLRNAYWRRLILEKSRHNSTKNVHAREHQCWRAEEKTGWKWLITFL